QGGASRMALEAGTTVIGSLPLDIRIRTGADTGVPIMISEPTGPVGRAYCNIAQAVVAGLGSQGVPHGSAVPTVTID
ncbi:MAG: Mrp/NBP35 family ATP-binding protein, partial [Gammaproteobacteria bacterium]|nr:Mrp/NBP35 family ATP-binding protein [Gammaproteobacteria bacterium]